MADFEVRTDSLRDASEQLNRIHHRVRDISGDAKRILSNTRGSITARLAMHLQRAVVCANINNCASDCKNISNTLNKVASAYESSEKRVMNAELFDEVNRPWLKDLFINIPNIPVIIVGIPKPVLPNIWDVILPWKPDIIFPRPWKPVPPEIVIFPKPFIKGKFYSDYIVGPGGQNPSYFTVGGLNTSLIGSGRIFNGAVM